MKRITVGKLFINWAAWLGAVTVLLSMVAGPALALVAANQVVSTSIKDGSILNRDIRQNVISSSRIKDGTLLNRDIDENVISSSRIRNGTIRNSDIAPAAAISDSKIEYQPKTGHLSIPVAELNPASNTYQYARTLTLIMTSGAGTFYAPVHLPRGAVVTKLEQRVIDNNPGNFVAAELSRLPNVSPPSAESMAVVTTNGAFDSPLWRKLTTSSITNPTIDNRNNAYLIAVYLSSPTNLIASTIVIEYEYTAP